MPPKSDLAVIGAGYVGLTTGLGLAAKLGIRVIFAERDPKRLAALRAKVCPIFETGLAELLTEQVELGRATFVESIEAIDFSRVGTAMVAVETPTVEGSVNLASLVAACREIARVTQGGALDVVVKSTVPPGTTEMLRETIFTSKMYGLAMIPEFLREGSAVRDFLEADRVVIGTDQDEAWQRLEKLFTWASEVVRMRMTEAELVKYANNNLLAALISFSNQLAMLAETFPNVDTHAVLDGVLLDRRWRIGGELPEVASYLRHGCGFGGSCFPKDIAGLSQTLRQRGVRGDLIEAVLSVNQSVRAAYVEAIKSALSPRGSRLAVLGLAFKAGTDDTRESVALDVLAAVVPLGIEIVVHDPKAELPAEWAGRVTLTRDLDQALTGADCAALLTAWPEYRDISERRLRELMRSPVVVDGRSVFRGKAMPGVRVITIGVTHGR